MKFVLALITSFATLLVALGAGLAYSGGAHATPMITGTASAQTSDASTAQPTVLVFWASWCSACKPVMADFAAEQRALLEASGAVVKAVQIDDRTPRGAIPAIEHVLSGESAAALKQAHSVRAVPWVVVLDADGEVISTPSAHHRPSEVLQWVKTDLALNL